MQGVHPFQHQPLNRIDNDIIDPIVVDINVEGNNLTFEVDTGSQISAVSLVTIVHYKYCGVILHKYL